MKKSLLLIILFASALGFSQEEKVEVPKIVIKVPLGESVQLDGCSITFLKVLEDSRCPTDVTCVWAGQAKVLVEISEAGNEPIQKELLFGGKSDNTLVYSEGYMLEAVSLSPQPTSATQGKLKYVLLISEEKK